MTKKNTVFRSWCSVFCRWGAINISRSLQKIEKERSDDKKGGGGVEKERERVYCEVGAGEEHPPSFKNLSSITERASDNYCSHQFL